MSRVSVCASDRNELVADVEAIPAALGAPVRVLADNGYATGREVSQLEGRAMEVLVPTGGEGQRRQHDFRAQPPEHRAKEPRADWVKAMQAKMEKVPSDTRILVFHGLPDPDQAYRGLSASELVTRRSISIIQGTNDGLTNDPVGELLRNSPGRIRMPWIESRHFAFVRLSSR